MAFEKETGDYGTALPFFFFFLLFTLSFFSFWLKDAFISLLHSAYTAFFIRSACLQSCFSFSLFSFRFLHILGFFPLHSRDE